MRSTLPTTVALALCAARSTGAENAGLDRRQMYDGLGVGYGSSHNSPFNAFWNEGLVPGQGFPQIGMSAYGYGLPGLGLTPFLAPDAAILAGAGEGEISEKDLDHLDEEQYGLDYLPNRKDGEPKPDPAYPGHFMNEGCDSDEGIEDGGCNAKDDNYRHHHHHHNTAASSLRQLAHSSTVGLMLAAGMVYLA